MAEQEIKVMQTRRQVLCALGSLPLAVSFPSRNSAEADESKWLKEIASLLQKELRLPAVWLACGFSGNIEAAVLGVRKAGAHEPATLSDPLTIASVSKPFAGLWVASAISKGKLNFESKVVDVIPELASKCLPEHRNITLGQLLTHTAGVIRNLPVLADNLSLEDYRAERIRHAGIVLSSPSPPQSKGREVYSNSGVTLAVSMAERALDVAYEPAAKDFFGKDLGLASWGVWGMNDNDTTSIPWPHEMDEGQARAVPPQTLHPHFIHPSGGAHCTVSDLAHFGLIATNASDRFRNLFSDELWDLLLKPAEGSTTTLSTLQCDGERVVFRHSGTLGPTASHLMAIPEWGLSIAVHTNADSLEFPTKACNAILDQLRRKRSRIVPSAPCRIRINKVETVDTTWKQVVSPTLNDSHIRIRLQFSVETASQTGDLQTVVKLGDQERRDDRYRGLPAGNHELHFEFDNPKEKSTRVNIEIDSLSTAKNRTPNTATHRTTLKLR